MKIQPLTGVLGAEIADVDLATELTTSAIEGIVAELVDALDRHLVVIVKQQNLSAGEQTELTHYFGAPCETPFVGTLPDYPEVIKVLKEADEVDAFNFGGAWHSDFSFLPRPPSYTLLHAVDVPAYGGDTVWTSNVAALDRLHPDLRKVLDQPGVFGVHSAKDAYSPKMQPIHSGLKHMDIRTNESANRQRHHPIIRTHPGNNKEVLFFNQAYVRDLAGSAVTEEWMPSFLRRIHHHTVSHEFTVRHHWHNGDLAIWDNRATQHLALNDYGGFRRELHRTTVEGEVPTR